MLIISLTGDIKKQPKIAQGMSGYPLPAVTYTTRLNTSSPPARLPTPTPVLLENGWYLYQDDTAGYSIQYPPEMRVVTLHREGKYFNSLVIEFENSETYQAMVIHVQPNPNHLSMEEIAWQKFSNEKNTLSLEEVKATVKSLQVGGLPAIQVAHSPYFYEFIILVSCQDYYFYIAPSTGNMGNSMGEEGLKTFFQILDTIQIGQ